MTSQPLCQCGLELFIIIEFLVVVALGTYNTWPKLSMTRRSWTFRRHVLGTCKIRTKKHMMRRSWTLHCCVLGAYNIKTKEHDNEFSSSLSWPWGPTTLKQKNTQWQGAEFLVIMSLGLTTLEQKKHNDEDLNSSSSCTWMTYNTGTKEHDNKELSSSLSWPYGPSTTMTRNWTPCCCVLGTCSITTTKKHDNEEPTPCHCAFEWPTTLEQKNMMTKNWTPCRCSFGDLEHWNKKNMMRRRWIRRHRVLEWPTTLQQKSMTTRSWTPHHHVPGTCNIIIFKKTWQWGAKLLVVMYLNDLQLWNKRAWRREAKLFVVVALRTCNTLTKKTRQEESSSSSLWL